MPRNNYECRPRAQSIAMRGLIAALLHVGTVAWAETPDRTPPSTEHCFVINSQLHASVSREVMQCQTVYCLNELMNKLLGTSKREPKNKLRLRSGASALKDSNRLQALWPFAGFTLNSGATRWQEAIESFSEFQSSIYDPVTEKNVSLGFSLPISWDKDIYKLPSLGWEVLIVKSINDKKKKLNALAGMSVIVDPEFRDLGVAKIMIQAMKLRASEHGYRHLIIPARPSRKDRHPRVPMEAYAAWLLPGTNLPYDPWLRTHVRMGAKLGPVSHSSAIYQGSVEQWQELTTERIESSGSYLIPGALSPVTMDVELGTGTYREPSVWVVYKI